MKSQLAADKALLSAAGAKAGTGNAALNSAVASFEPLLFNNMVVVLDGFSRARHEAGIHALRLARSGSRAPRFEFYRDFCQLKVVDEHGEGPNDHAVWMTEEAGPITSSSLLLGGPAHDQPREDLSHFGFCPGAAAPRSMRLPNVAARQAASPGSRRLFPIRWDIAAPQGPRRLCHRVQLWSAAGPGRLIDASGALMAGARHSSDVRFTFRHPADAALERRGEAGAQGVNSRSPFSNRSPISSMADSGIDEWRASMTMG